MSIKEGVRDADMVILATPVRSIPAIASDVIRYAKRGAIITDAGSTKSWVVENVEKILKGNSRVFFVGSHPMSGSESAGVESAREDLLDGSPCIVTPTGRTRARTLREVSCFWKALGANVKIMSPLSHDRSVSFISHLPHLVAFSLVGAVPEKDIAYAAEGFKDTTRVASSDPALWADIFMTNKAWLMRSADAFKRSYEDLLSALGQNDYDKVVRFLARSKSKRDAFVYGKGS
jgi:prephenate dehydrogenase